MIRYIVHKYFKPDFNSTSFQIIKKCALKNCKYQNYTILNNSGLYTGIYQNRCLYVCDKFI